MVDTAAESSYVLNDPYMSHFLCCSDIIFIGFPMKKKSYFIQLLIKLIIVNPASIIFLTTHDPSKVPWY